jgi:arginase family enzyme
MKSMSTPLAFIGAPTSAGAFAPGQETAPHVLRDAGIIERFIEALTGALSHAPMLRQPAEAI